MTGQKGLRVALLLSTAALVGSFAAIASVAITNDDRIEDIQSSRHENILTDCVLKNGQNRAIIRFVVAATRDDGLERLARARFPVRGDCEAYVRSRLR